MSPFDVPRLVFDTRWRLGEWSEPTGKAYEAENGRVAGGARIATAVRQLTGGRQCPSDVSEQPTASGGKVVTQSKLG